MLATDKQLPSNYVLTNIQYNQQKKRKEDLKQKWPYWYINVQSKYFINHYLFYKIFQTFGLHKIIQHAARTLKQKGLYWSNHNGY